MEGREYIKARIPVDELLAGLAEEASELAQAALKYRRSLTGLNPTPIGTRDARFSLLEEAADVRLYLDLILADSDTEKRFMSASTEEKMVRWEKRLKRRESE